MRVSPSTARELTNDAASTQRSRTFSVRPSLASAALISRCFSALKMMKADLNRFGASGAFFIRVTPPAFLPLRPFVGGAGPSAAALAEGNAPPPAATAAAAATACCCAAIDAGFTITIGNGIAGVVMLTPYPYTWENNNRSSSKARTAKEMIRVRD